MRFGCRPAQEKRQRLGLADQSGKIAIARGLPRLPLQILQLAFDFADHIVEPAHIGFGGTQTKFGFVAALVQARNAGGFFQNSAPRKRLLADEHADLALPHKSGRARARRCIGEENLHIALANVAAIDAIDRSRLALDAPRNLDGVIFVIGAGSHCGPHCR